MAVPIAAPAILSDGTVVVVQKQFHDSVGLTTESQPMLTTWRVRPGGTATSTATFGDLTLITTSNRQLIGYDRYGRWLWQATLPDQTVVAPTRLADLAVVATLDGSITAVTLTTGQIAWTAKVRDAVRAQPQTQADHLVVADLSDTVTCFGTDGTTEWSQDSLPTSNFAITPGADPVVVVGVGGRRAVALSLTDGTQRWSLPLRMSFTTMLGLDHAMVVRDGNLTLGLDPATGTTAWTWDRERSYAAAGQGNQLLLLTENRLIALDDHGRQTKDWAVPLGDLGVSGATLSLGRDRVLVWGQHAVLLGTAS
jgi:outer membrane protein assembly factor BamB